VRATPSIAPPESEATTAPSLHDASSRSSGSIRLATPETYYGKSLKEHTNFMWQCDVNFRRDPRQFSDDASKVLYAMQYLRAEPRDRWRAQEATFGRDQATWQEFSDFLLDLIQNPVNRLLTQAQRYSDARQKPNQSVHSYVTYVENLEDELEPYSEDQRRLHLLTTLRPELRTAITSHQNIPESRAGLIALAARLEENLGATHGHSATKSTGPRRAPAQTANTNVNTNSSTNPNTIPVGGTRTQVVAGTYPARSQRGGGGRGAGGRGASRGGRRGHSSDLSHITCYRCGQIGHYSTTCTLPAPGGGNDSAPKNGKS
jgi:hypothetical protein